MNNVKKLMAIRGNLDEALTGQRAFARLRQELDLGIDKEDAIKETVHHYHKYNYLDLKSIWLRSIHV